MDKLAVVLRATHGADDPLKLVEWDGNHGAVVVDFDFPDIPHLMMGALRQRADNMVGGDFICTANIDGDMPISPAGIPVPVFPV